MKTIVIHPKDYSTDFLSEIYSDKEWYVVNDNRSESELKKLTKQYERVVMLGHGTEDGLIGFNRLIINSSWADLLLDKICVCIWCNADEFVKRYGLKGFYTGMIISEEDEAVMYSISTNLDSIFESNKDFALAIKNSIDDVNMLEKAKMLYSGKSSVVEFNRNRLYFK